ncbi:MAG TPA: HNH endonuclease signature motif containing protein [Candidatus Krumholzibacteria bacterium]|nr:HNH endonuclease signature motif containing protein [Candidatus Krumholzibacteria bacterium]HRX52699.1 HNH endonuclease signature motif containing protein [Candidatus Krumholzibacteria bacterium]
MNSWWVNQNKTYRHERGGGYLWSPKFKANRARNPFYDAMRLVAPGDVILSYAKTRIQAYGIATSPCYEAPKPSEFGSAGETWADIGWRVDVAYHDLPRPLRPADHIQALRPLLPPKYSPLTGKGVGVQSVYLTRVPPRLMSQLALLIGAPLLDVLEQPPLIARDPAHEASPVQERWEKDLVRQIQQLDDIPETDREQLIYARVGQGKFRGLVYAQEKRCRVTRVDRPEHLIASHIKPWRHGSNAERLDPDNGLMLTPTVDHLFDRGFLTFTPRGEVRFSPAAHRESLLRMGLDPDVRLDVGGFSARQRQYLEFHGDQIFLGAR